MTPHCNLGLSQDARFDAYIVTSHDVELRLPAFFFVNNSSMLILRAEIISEIRKLLISDKKNRFLLTKLAITIKMLSIAYLCLSKTVWNLIASP